MNLTGLFSPFFSTLLASSIVITTTSAASDAATSGNPGPDHQIPPKLFSAIRNGDPKELRTLLRSETPVNVRDETGATPLMYAALYAGADCVELLLDHGADPNATNKAGATALMWGVREFAIAKVLLDHGADANVQSVLGNRALNIAAYYPDSKRVVEALLEKGADVHLQNSDGITPMLAASMAGDIGTLKLLIARGADINFRTATRQGLARRSALENAVAYGHLDCVRLLLDHGADLNAIGPFGPALSAAAFAGQLEMAKLLLERGAQANIPAPGRRDTGGETPLIFASMTERDDPRLVELLLANGADIHAKDNAGNSALGWAKKRGRTSIVASLLRAGAQDGLAASPDGYAHAEQKIGLPREDLPDARVAAAKAINIALRGGAVFTEKTSCFSCHQQSLPGMAAAMALRRGIAFDEKTARAEASAVIGHMEAAWESTLQVNIGVRTAEVPGYGLLGLEGIALPPQGLIDALVHRVAAKQAKDGRWDRPFPRPPMGYTDVTGTALALRLLKRYPLPGRRQEFEERIARGTAWLRQVNSASTEERVFQLLGLAWVETKPGKLKKLAAALLAEQRPDGGWAQLPTLESDAYATGQTLYALHVAGGIPVSHPAYERGVRYLLKTQQADGSWFVRTRTFPLQKHFDTGFPYGKDQWVSTPATSWAAMALMLTFDAQRVSASPISDKRSGL